MARLDDTGNVGGQLDLARFGCKKHGSKTHLGAKCISGRAQCSEVTNGDRSCIHEFDGLPDPCRVPVGGNAGTVGEPAGEVSFRAVVIDARSRNLDRRGSLDRLMRRGR